MGGGVIVGCVEGGVEVVVGVLVELLGGVLFGVGEVVGKDVGYVESVVFGDVYDLYGFFVYCVEFVLVGIDVVY